MSDGVFEILAMVTIIFAFLFGYSSGKHYGRLTAMRKEKEKENTLVTHLARWTK